eukprot:gene1439-31158_t
MFNTYEGMGDETVFRKHVRQVFECYAKEDPSFLNRDELVKLLHDLKDDLAKDSPTNKMRMKLKDKRFEEDKGFGLEGFTAHWIERTSKSEKKAMLDFRPWEHEEEEACCATCCPGGGAYSCGQGIAPAR